MLTYLDGFAEKDFEGAAARKITLPFLPPGKGLTGASYFANFALPNFFFHVTTAYAILRHNGVELGKRDYLGEAMELIDV